MARNRPPRRSPQGMDPQVLVTLLELNLQLVDASFRSPGEMLVKERIAALLWKAGLYDAAPDFEAQEWLREQGFTVVMPREEDEDL